MGAHASSNFYGELPSNGKPFTDKGMWAGIATTSQEDSKNINIRTNFWDPSMNIYSVFNKFDFSGSSRATPNIIKSNMSREEIAKLLINAYEHIDNIDDVIEYLIQQEDLKYLDFISPIENIFNSSDHFAKLIRNIIISQQKLSSTIKINVDDYGFRFRILFEIIGDLAEIAKTSAKPHERLRKLIRTSAEYIQMNAPPPMLSHAAPQFKEEGSGTFEPINDFVPVHGISSNAQFLFVLMGNCFLRCYPLLPGGALMPPKQITIKSIDPSLKDASFTKNASLVVTDSEILIYDQGKVANMRIEDFFKYGESMQMNVRSCPPIKAQISDGLSLVEFKDNGKKSVLSVKYKDQTFDFPIPNQEDFANDCPIETNGLTVSFYIRIAENKMKVRTFSLVDEKELKTQSYDSPDIIYSICCDSYNRCHWAVVSEDGVKRIRRYYYGGPINPKIINNSQYVYEQSPSYVPHLLTISNFALNYLGANAAPVSLLPDEKSMKDLACFLGDVSNAAEGLPKIAKKKLSFLIAEIIDFGIRIKGFESDKIRRKILKIIPTMIPKVAYFLFFNNLDFFLKDIKGITTLVGIFANDAPNCVNFAWKKMEQSKEFSRLSLSEPNAFISIFPTSMESINNIKPELASLVFLHQKCLICQTEEYLETHPGVQISPRQVQQNEKSPLDLFVEYSTFIIQRFYTALCTARSAKEVDESFLLKIFDNYIHTLSAVYNYHVVAQITVPLLYPVLTRSIGFLNGAPPIGNTHLFRIVLHTFFVFGKLCATLLNVENLSDAEKDNAWILQPNGKCTKQLEDLISRDKNPFDDQRISEFLNSNNVMEQIYKKYKSFMHKGISDACKEADKYTLIALARWGGIVDEVISYDGKKDRSKVFNSAITEMTNLRIFPKKKAEDLSAEEKKKRDNYIDKVLLLLRLNCTPSSDEIFGEIKKFLKSDLTAQDMMNAISLQGTRNYLTLLDFDIMRNMFIIAGKLKPIAIVFVYTLITITSFKAANTVISITKPGKDMIERISEFFSMLLDISEYSSTTCLYTFAFRFFRDVTCLPQVKETLMNKVLEEYMKNQDSYKLFALSLALVRGVKEVPVLLKINEFRNKLPWLVVNEALKTAEANTTLFNTIKSIISSDVKSLPYLSRVIIKAYNSSKVPRPIIQNDISIMINEIGSAFITHENIGSISYQIWMIRKIVKERDELGKYIEQLIRSFDEKSNCNVERIVGSMVILGSCIENVHPYCTIKYHETPTRVNTYIAVPFKGITLKCYKSPIKFSDSPIYIDMELNNVYSVPSLNILPNDLQEPNEMYGYIVSMWDRCTKCRYGWVLSTQYMQTVVNFMIDKEFVSKIRETQIKEIKYLMPFVDIPETFNSCFIKKEIIKSPNDFSMIDNNQGFTTYISPELNGKTSFTYKFGVKKAIKAFIGVICSNLDYFRTKYSLVDLETGTFYPYNNKAEFPPATTRGEFEMYVDQIEGTFTIDGTSYPFPYGDVFKVVLCIQSDVKPSIDIVEKVKPYSKYPMPSIDTVGCTFAEEKPNFYNEKDITKPVLTSVDGYDSVKNNVPVNEISESIYYNYIPPPNGVVLHFDNAWKTSMDLKEEFLRAKEEKLFYQFSTIALMRYANTKPTIISVDLIPRFVSLLAVQLELFNLSSDKMPVSFNDPIWKISSEHTILFNSLDNEAVQILEKLSRTSEFGNSLKMAISNLVKSKEVNFLRYPSQFHRWLRGGTLKGNIKIESPNVIVAPLRSAFKETTCKDINGNFVYLPEVFNDVASLSIDSSTVLMDISLYSINNPSNMWAFDTIFEPLVLLKCLYHTQKESEFNAFIRRMLMLMFVSYSPLIAPFMYTIMSSLSTLFSVPITSLVSDKRYTNTLKLFGATLKDYNGGNKDRFLDIYRVNAMAFGSKLCMAVSPAFPELYGSHEAPVANVTIKAPILDFGAMKDGFKERMQLIQILDPKKPSVSQFQFWEAFGLWLRAAEKWPYKHDFINVTHSARGNILTLFNPLGYHYTYKFNFRSNVTDDSLMTISNSIKFFGAAPVQRDKFEIERGTNDKILYIKLACVEGNWSNATITINKSTPSSIGQGNEECMINTTPFRRQFIQEITEFATQWSKEDTEDLKEIVPQNVLESNTSEEAFIFSKEPFKKYSTNVIRMRLLMMQYYNKIVAKKLPDIPEDMWKPLSHYLSHDFAIKEIMECYKMAPNDFQFKILSLDRLKAQRRILDGSGTADDSLISQLGQQFKTWPLDALRIKPGNTIWNVKFVGEKAYDAGGPTREALSQGCSSIFEKTSGLTVPTPNGRDKHGPNSEFFIPFPTIPGRDNDYWAIGNLFGVIVRSGFSQDLPFASVFWKFLAHEQITEKDFTSIEKGFDDTVKALRKTRDDGEFARQNEWATTDFLGNTVVLPGKQKGQIVEAIQVEQYIKECVQYKFELIRRPMEIIRNAFEENNGVKGHPLYTERLLSRMLQGTQTISVAEMKELTSYSGYSETDQTIVFYWKAVERLRPEQLRLLLMFQTTLTRLPNRSVQSYFGLQIDKLACSKPNDMLPTASTCFYRLHLPPYTNENACYNKLVYAITYCQTMDNV